MSEISGVSKERLEVALREIRKDNARLHRDIALGLGNEARWIFILMWIVCSNFLINAFNLGVLFALGGAGLLVATYRVIDANRIYKRAMQKLNEPVEPMWDTEVKL